MSQVQFEVPQISPRNRLTVAFRLILAIPHLIVVQVLGVVVQVATVIHWFIQVFTGNRNSGIFDFTNKYLAYYARVEAYAGLLHDDFPGFFSDDGKTPVRYSLEYSEQANRLTVGLRFIWIIPAAMLAILVGIAAGVVTLVAWFAIVITGKLPAGWQAFLVRAHRYSLRLYAYQYLLTDDYPRYG